MKVGDTVWQYHQPDKPLTVSKVGVKYFQIEGDKRSRYRIKEMTRVSEYLKFSDMLWTDRQALLDQREFIDLQDKVRKGMVSFGKLPYTLDQLRRIKQIIDEQ